jgi:hypothetical protein
MRWAFLLTCNGSVWVNVNVSRRTQCAIEGGLSSCFTLYIDIDTHTRARARAQLHHSKR